MRRCYVKVKEGIQEIRGEFGLQVYKRGKLVDEYVDHNLIVEVGRQRLAELAAGKSTAAIKYIGFGSGKNYVANGRALETDKDTTLEDLQLFEFKTSEVDGAAVEVNGMDARFNFCLTEAEANGLEIREIGLFCADGVMFSHRVRTNKKRTKILTIDKEDDLEIKGYYILHF